MTSTEATQSSNLIMQSCLLGGQNMLVLFDFGATHSFISNACVGRLSLEKRDLGCELLVLTPSSSQVATSSVCVGCSMEVASRRFKVNLVCLSLEGLNVILGMNWLSNNHIIIDCGRRSLVFPEHEGLELISTREALKALQEGAKCFMVVAQPEKKSAVEFLQSIPFASEYANVFPDEVPGLSPSRDIDFTIDLIPGAGPVSIAPYRMGPAELAKLKKQIGELLEKGVYLTKHITMGSSSLIGEKEGWEFATLRGLQTAK